MVDIVAATAQHAGHVDLSGSRSTVKNHGVRHSAPLRRDSRPRVVHALISTAARAETSKDEVYDHRGARRRRPTRPRHVTVLGPRCMRRRLMRYRFQVRMDFNTSMEDIGKGIDAAGVAIIVLGALVATVAAVSRVLDRQADVYRRYRRQLGRTILLGLELLVAADIIRTVAVTPTLTSVAVLAGIVVIRTFLSFSLELEITGRWPWQKNEGEGERPAT